MKIYMVRHGLTDWNIAGKWQGSSDITLNETGIAQAQTIAARLADSPIEKIYTSPLSRAKTTAETIQSKLSVDIVLDKRLQEVYLGPWEGLTIAEIKAQYSEEFQSWETDYNAEITDVENFTHLQNRAFNALSDIVAEKPAHKCILLVTHSGWLRALLTKILGIPPEKKICFEISNVGLHILEYDADKNSFRVLCLNDTTHISKQ